MDNSVDFNRFRELLQSLENQQASIRVRRSGEPWTPFLSVILLSDTAMILEGSNDRKIIVNVRNVIEFELDRPFEDFAAHTHYEIQY